MDKKILLMRNLADIMSAHFSELQEIVKKYSRPLTKSKHDGSPVTELDLALSSFIEDISKKQYPDVCFYSEENYNEWKFPLLALDPLDGTREYIENRPEWSVSLGLFENENFEGEGWVSNPLTNETFTMHTVEASPEKEKFHGEVSRTEFNYGVYKNFHSEKFTLEPRGSIAYKLGKLSHGKIDFVISMYPKHIWDIAGGTLLCKKAGIEFYAGGKLVTKVMPSYEPPLIWCPPSLFSELSQLMDKRP